MWCRLFVSYNMILILNLQVKDLEKQLNELTQRRLDYLEKMQEQQMSVQVTTFKEMFLVIILIGTLFLSVRIFFSGMCLECLGIFYNGTCLKLEGKWK